MDENNKIWSGLEAETYTAKFHFVLLERDYDVIYIDETTCKLIGRNGDEIDILLEFSAIQRLNYELIGDLNSIYENPDKITDHIDNFIKYDESWTEPVDKTGWERFDFIDKEFFEHVHYTTMWPNNNTKLSSGYFEEIWSDKFGVIESLLSIAEVKMWCKLNNAKLLLISAFSPNFNRDYFFNTLIGDGKENKNYLYKNKDYTNLLLNSNIDWDNFIRPNNFNCVTDFLCYLENREDLINSSSPHHYYEYAYSLDKMSPNGYITKCAHPSNKGHEKIAELIHNEIIKNKKDKLI